MGSWAIGKLFVNDGPFTTVDQGYQQVKLYVLGGFHCGAWLSLVERYVRVVEVGSSNLLAPTKMQSMHFCESTAFLLAHTLVGQGALRNPAEPTQCDFSFCCQIGALKPQLTSAFRKGDSPNLDEISCGEVVNQCARLRDTDR